MKTKFVSWVLVLLTGFGLAPAQAQSELIAYTGAVWVDHEINDGDSFMVEADGKRMHIRLYFADAPETVVYQSHDARRVQDQARHFGIEHVERIIWLGKQAAAFTQAVLSRPFTVYTSHARAPGGKGSERIYAFVVTSTGRDLGELLVENGLARSFGISRQRYDGISQTELEMKLRDIEGAAMLANRGIWSESDPDLIVQYRAQMREEKQAMQAIMSSAIGLLEDPVNINSASRRELERIPGIGPVTANRIIQHRPYATLEDLKSVKGIGAKLFERIQSYITVDTPKAVNSLSVPARHVFRG